MLRKNEASTIEYVSVFEFVFVSREIQKWFFQKCLGSGGWGWVRGYCLFGLILSAKSVLPRTTKSLNNAFQSISFSFSFFVDNF